MADAVGQRQAIAERTVLILRRLRRRSLCRPGRPRFREAG
jgi:hypothetical protein